MCLSILTVEYRILRSYYLAKACSEEEVKDFLNANVKTREIKPQEERVDQTAEIGSISKIEVEKKHRREEPKEQEKEEPKSEKERTPREIHEALRRTVNVFGKTFKFKHEWIDDIGLSRKDYKIDEKEGIIIIYTNTAFPAFLATNDKAFYAALNIAEAIAEVYAKESECGIEKLNEAKDLILRKASELKNQIEEEKSNKEKQERRTQCELCGAKIDYKSPRRNIVLNEVKKKEIQKRYYRSQEFKERIKLRKNEIREKIFEEYLECLRSTKKDSSNHNSD